ncbi:MAG: hypothetical protein ACRENE_21475 [Polyangiaceae bacterium]
MPRPHPRSARLTTRAPGSRPPPPPFGLPAWVEDGEATVVELDGSAGDLSRPQDVAEQIPDSRSFEGRTLVVVLARPAAPAAAWKRLMSMGTPRVSRAARCSALLMRGYVDIEAATDEATSDLAWGWSS